jgi:hypothetical protein
MYFKSPMLAFCHYNKYPRQLTYKERRFILAHSFRGFSLGAYGDAVSGQEAKEREQVE